MPNFDSEDLKAIAETMGTTETPTPAQAPAAAAVEVSAEPAQPVATLEAAATPAVETPAPAVETPQTPQFNLTEAARQVGLEFGETATPDEIQQRLIAGIRQLQDQRSLQARELEAARIRAEAYEHASRRQMEQQASQAQKPVPQPTQRKPWEKPQVDERLIRAYWQPVRDHEGKPVVEADGSIQHDFAPHTPPEVIAQFNSYRQWKEQWQDVMSNPEEMMKLVREQAREEAETAYAARMKEYQEQQAVAQQRAQTESYVQSEIDKYAGVLFERDPFTNQINRNALTPLGRQMHDQINVLMQNGMQNQQMAWEYASRFVGLQAAAPQVQPASPQQTQAETIRKNFREATKNGLAKAPINHNPQAGGTLNTPLPQTFNREPDLGEMLRAEFGGFLVN